MLSKESGGKRIRARERRLIGVKRGPRWSLILAPALVFALGQVPGPVSAGSTPIFEIPSDPGEIVLLESSMLRGRIRHAALARRLAQEIWFDGDQTVVTVHQLQRFLSKQASPMADHSGAIIGAANRHGIDPRLIVAIAGVESTFGRNCGGFNAWGWNNGKTRWSSWEHSIEAFARLFSQNYPMHHNVKRMAPRYNPNTPDAWSRKVTLLISQIDRVPSLYDSAEVPHGNL